MVVALVLEQARPVDVVAGVMQHEESHGGIVRVGEHVRGEADSSGGQMLAKVPIMRAQQAFVAGEQAAMLQVVKYPSPGEYPAWGHGRQTPVVPSQEVLQVRGAARKTNPPVCGLAEKRSRRRR